MNEKKTVLADFMGVVCAACGGPKRQRMSHCAGCYRRLPRQMQMDLYKRFGKGYEEAFAAATAWLRQVLGKSSNVNDVRSAATGEL